METTPQYHMSQHLLDRVRTAFPAPKITPKTSEKVIMYDAGAHSVVEWLENFIGSSTVEAAEPSSSLPARERSAQRQLGVSEQNWWKA